MTSNAKPRPLCILSIEGEPIISRRLERLSREILGEQLTTFTSAQTLEAAFDELESNPADILLLDLNLDGEDGFELLSRFMSYSTQTIIVSAYGDRAVDAFEYGVVDFVPKPFSRGRLSVAFDRALRTVPTSAASKLRFLTFRSGRRTDVVPLRDICLIKGADKYSEITLKDGSVKLHDKRLSDFEGLLPDSFFRIHKSYIVPIARVKRIESSPGSKYDALLDTGELVPIGRTRVADLRARLGI